MGVTAAIVAGVVAVGSTAYQMKNSSDQRSQAQDAADQQQKQQDDLQKQQRDTMAAANETDSQQRARMRQQQNASPLQGSQGTILTSPLGIANSSTPNTGGKTLLGM